MCSASLIFSQEEMVINVSSTYNYVLPPLIRSWRHFLCHASIISTNFNHLLGASTDLLRASSFPSSQPDSMQHIFCIWITHAETGMRRRLKIAGLPKGSLSSSKTKITCLKEANSSRFYCIYHRYLLMRFRGSIAANENTEVVKKYLSCS